MVVGVVFLLGAVALIVYLSRLEYLKPRAPRNGDGDGVEEGLRGCGGEMNDEDGDGEMSVQMEKRIERLDWRHREVLGAVLERLEGLEGLHKCEG